MPRTMKKTAQQLVTSALFAFPGVSFSGESAPIDFLDESQLVLEIRYCECEATKPNGGPSDLLPDFLTQSKVLKGAVSAGDRGFIASEHVSMAYRLETATDSSEGFEFSYAGTYASSGGTSSGQGRFVLKEGQWVNLFGSLEKTGTESQHTNVVVRLFKPGES